MKNPILFLILSPLFIALQTHAGDTECPPFEAVKSSTTITEDQFPEVAHYLGISYGHYPVKKGPRAGLAIPALRFPIQSYNSFLANIGDTSDDSFKNGVFNGFEYACSNGVVETAFTTSNNEKVGFRIDLSDASATLRFFEPQGKEAANSPVYGFLIPDVAAAEEVMRLEKAGLSKDARFILTQGQDQQLWVKNALIAGDAVKLPLTLPSGVHARIFAGGQNLLLHANGKKIFYTPGDAGSIFPDASVLLLDLKDYLDKMHETTARKNCGGAYVESIGMQIGVSHSLSTGSLQNLVEDNMDKIFLSTQTHSTIFVSRSGKSSLLLDAEGNVKPGNQWENICQYTTGELNARTRTVFVTDDSGRFKVVFDLDSKTYQAEKLQ